MSVNKENSGVVKNLRKLNVNEISRFNPFYDIVLWMWNNCYIAILYKLILLGQQCAVFSTTVLVLLVLQYLVIPLTYLVNRFFSFYRIVICKYFNVLH